MSLKDNPIAMTIAGFDPSGGAGILNDIKTFHALGVYGTAVVTALTAQNVQSVRGVMPVSTDFIEKQVDAVCEGEKIKYAKTGMLFSDDIVKTVACMAREHELKVVVDPVMVAGSGGFLSKDGISGSIKKHLLPIALLATPNIYEAQAISGVEIKDNEDVIKAALKIGKICNVVVTGGHLKGSDIFYNGSVKVFEGELVESENTHGTGCTYSSAITAYLSKGCNLEESVERAGKFVKKSIKWGTFGTLNQFWKFHGHII